MAWRERTDPRSLKRVEQSRERSGGATLAALAGRLEPAALNRDTAPMQDLEHDLYVALGPLLVGLREFTIGGRP